MCLRADNMCMMTQHPIQAKNTDPHQSQDVGLSSPATASGRGNVAQPHPKEELQPFSGETFPWPFSDLFDFFFPPPPCY